MAPNPRRSPRGVTQSRRLSGYAVGEESEERSRGTHRSPVPGSSSKPQGQTGSASSTKTLSLSSSDSEAAQSEKEDFDSGRPRPRPRRARPASKRSDFVVPDSDSEEWDVPVTGSKRTSGPVHEDAREPVSKKADSGSSKNTSRQPPVPPTRQEREQHAAAAKMNAPSKRTRTESAQSGVVTIEDDDDDDTPRAGRVFNGKNAHKRFMENDIAISTAAKNSILGAVQDSDAYDGYKYLSSEWTDGTKTALSSA
ncbi:unnamed protein product [Tilletia controversa]|nr:unnamed protein product [Tilletia controversa]CAD6935562.1 unnamed protein product [Tilletia controversa]